MKRTNYDNWAITYRFLWVLVRFQLMKNRTVLEMDLLFAGNRWDPDKQRTKLNKHASSTNI